MKPHVLQEVPQEDAVLFRKIVAVLTALPDVDLGHDQCGKIDVSCHMITRALAEFFPVQVVDGYIFQGYVHSWLVTKNLLIIDPYPPLMLGGPVLLVRDTRMILSPWKNAYFPFTDGRYAAEFQTKQFLSQVAAVTQSVQQTIARLSVQV